MQIRLLFFAALRDRVGQSERDVELPEEVTTIAALRQHLEATDGSLSGRLESVRFAVNESFVEEAMVLNAGDVVALIPPVTGG